jgi:2-aminoethylphosphonate-pyruvate transaminase
MKIKRNILLNPGPATTTDSVKLAQVVPDICPREEDFGIILNQISEDLTSFVADKDKYSTILFGGSGTASIESILSSVIPNDNSIIIINNGSYGDRMCKIAERYNLKYIEYKSSKLSSIDILRLEEAIENNKKLSHIAVVHNETTTGLLNDIEKIGTLAKKYNLKVIVDAMSSYGAIPINMEKLNISYLAASSNKNLQGLPGVSFVIAENDCLIKLKYVKQLSYYLSLKEQYEYFKINSQTRFTPPVQTLYALKQAINETKAETIKKRYSRYKKSWRSLTAGINKLGLNYLVKEENHSKIITAINLPPKINFKELHDYFYLNGITIYPGKINELNTFRIANIGDIDHKDINHFLNHLKSFLISKSNF